MRSIERGLICGVTLLFAAAGCSGHSSHPSAARGSTTTTAAAQPLHSTPLTTAQLDAHLGVGAPKGWEPIDGGDARLWIPKRWSYASWGTCDGSPSTFAATSPTLKPWDDDGYVPSLPRNHCATKRQFLVAQQALEFVPLSTRPHARPAFMVHGYRIFLVKRATSATPWDAYDIPQLNVQIATHGAKARRILDTLGPSARYVALDRAYAIPSSDARDLHAVGVSLSIPRSWEASTPKPFVGCPPVETKRPATALTIVKHVEPPPQPIRPTGGTGPDFGLIRGPDYCTPSPQPPVSTLTFGTAPADGGAVYERASDCPMNQWYHSAEPGFATTRGQPITTLRQGTTTVTVWVAPFSPNSLDLFFHRDGSSLLHALTIGLGRDGRVAARVIASIRATT